MEVFVAALTVFVLAVFIGYEPADPEVFVWS